MKSPFITILVATMLVVSLQLSPDAQAQALWQPQQGGVSGAPANYNQYDGSGRGMMNYCPYPQTQYDPASRFDKDPEVMEVKQDVKDASDRVTDLQKQQREAKRAYNLQKWSLHKYFSESYQKDPDAVMKEIDSCVKVSQSLPGLTDKAVADAISHSGVPASSQVYCLATILPMMNSSNPITIPYWCTQEKYVDAKGTGFVGGPNTTADLINDCAKTVDETYKSWKQTADLEKQVKEAIKQQAEANKALTKARNEAQENAQNNPPDATNVGCSECGQQQPGMSKGRFWGALGLIAGVSTLSILGQEHQYNNIARMGYIGNPNQIGIFGSGISSGMSAGFPFMQSAMYGQQQLGGMQGGMGCAQTVNGSQFAQQQGPFYNGAQNGNYFPAGGQYMAGAGPYGVSPYPGQYGGGQYPYGGGQGGYPGGGYGGGYNPQAQYAQYMNTQYIDQLRAQQVAMAGIQYGLNNANQQFGYAQSLLASQQYGGGGGGVYGGGGYGGGGYGGGANYFGGQQQWGAGQQQFFNGAGCGAGSFGSTFSICGSTGFGGSLQPTNTNYMYQNYNNGQNGMYNNGGFNSSGTVLIR